jgi:hypothetical protein
MYWYNYTETVISGATKWTHSYPNNGGWTKACRGDKGVVSEACRANTIKKRQWPCVGVAE